MILIVNEQLGQVAMFYPSLIIVFLNKSHIY